MHFFQDMTTTKLTGGYWRNGLFIHLIESWINYVLLPCCLLFNNYTNVVLNLQNPPSDGCCYDINIWMIINMKNHKKYFSCFALLRVCWVPVFFTWMLFAVVISTWLSVGTVVLRSCISVELEAGGQKDLYIIRQCCYVEERYSYNL